MSYVKWNLKSPRLVYSAAALAALAFAVTSVTLYSSRSFFSVSHVSRLPPIPCPAVVPCDSPVADENWQFQVLRDGENYGLTDAQCSSAFPKLFVEIDKAVARRKDNPISLQELDSREWWNGMVRGMVYNGELLIVGAKGLEGYKSRGLATLHSLNRALTSSADRSRIPNIEFILIVEDFTEGEKPIWVYTKREEDEHRWIMPDFGYWSWPESGVSSYSKFRRRVRAMEEGVREDGESIGALAFGTKTKKLAWRGALITNPLRMALYELAKGKSWADVQYLNWDDKGDVKKKLLKMEDYCKYMFLGHVEGRSYSGRGKYLQNCRSVFVSHELKWIEAHHAALVASGPDQNFVQVQRDWSDLESTIKDLIERPQEAERIADNGVKIFRDRYLTPAAEACYWRRLIKGWASVSFEPHFFADPGKTVWRGVPFESFALLHNVTWPLA